MPGNRHPREMTVILGGKPLRAQDPAYRPSLALFFVFRRFLPSHNPRYKPRGESRGLFVHPRVALCLGVLEKPGRLGDTDFSDPRHVARGTPRRNP